ncbi:orotidine 5'-phosphate decarboxylase [Massospora cicadina]|nr:orotidine 5'-phosphate decarboxylase [Massospora cicadina]
MADALGPYVCLVKTHIDIVEGFDYSVVEELQRLAIKHEFMIFEDRKFADIGNTVKLQYSKGVYRIAQWADFTNCHIIPGEGIVAGLKEVGLDVSVVPRPRALLLLAQMSSTGSLAVGDYTQKNLELACKHKDFVAGFIASGNLDPSDFSPIVMTPGVALAASGDGLGQQYRTPDLILANNLSDIIIVGRNILNASDPVTEAAKYRAAGWNAYLSSLET